MHSIYTHPDGPARQFVFNEQLQSNTEVYRFTEFDNICNTTLVHVPSQECILLIGGNRCGIQTGDDIENPIGIWRFCLCQNTWTKVMEFEYQNIDAVLTLNEEYIIIKNAVSLIEWQKENRFLVLDIRDKEDYKLKMSSVVPPGNCDQSQTWMAILDSKNTLSEFITIGWIRILFRRSLFENLELPPLYIMQMISNWYAQEMLHVVGNDIVRIKMPG